MKILFDEGIPRQLASHFPDGFQVSTAQVLGWGAKANGELLRLAKEECFAALITLDKRMQHEQNPQTLPMPVFVLSTSQQKDVEYLGNLIASEVLPLLEQGAENRFYPLGAGHKVVKYDTPSDKHDDLIREPLVPAYSLSA